jgi:dTDP-4-dehydrorhamnose 3,5-epimerase
MITDLMVTPLKRIQNPKGDVFHALKCSEASFSGFGEAYFSSVISDEIKGWKKHTKMVLNLIVPSGAVKFIIYDDRENSKSCGQYSAVTLSEDNYNRLTVPAGVWMAFQGIGANFNLLLNIASIEHDPLEAKTVSLDHFDYDWSEK